MALPSIWPDPGSNKQFDAFLNKLLKQANSISQMGLVHDDGKTLYLYDQFGFSDAELDKRFYACRDMIKLFPPSLKINTPLDHLLQANNSAICLSNLGPGWYLVVIGNLNGIPGGFPALCIEYRQGMSGEDTKKKATKTKTVSSDNSQIIGNADEFFVNPLGKDGN